jgi:hypothetical protein
MKNPSLTLSDLCRRLAMPFLLFSMVLFGLLLLSWMLLMPNMTRMNISGKLLSAHSVQEYHDDIKQEILVLEDERNQLITPVYDERHINLVQQKQHTYSFYQMKRLIENAAYTLIPDTHNVVNIFALHLDQETQIISLRGEVTNVGPRSMTVLAQFIDALDVLPFVSSVTQPSFTREEDPDRGFYSPFAITLSFAQR